MKKGRAVLAMILLSAMLLCSCGGGGDVSPPTLMLTSTATSPTKASPVPMTATFSESVTGFVVGDITLDNFLVRCHEYVTLVDHLLGGPFESLDAIRNSATMKGVLGWSNQLAESRGYVRQSNKGG